MEVLAESFDPLLIGPRHSVLLVTPLSVHGTPKIAPFRRRWRREEKKLGEPKSTASLVCGRALRPPKMTHKRKSGAGRLKNADLSRNDILSWDPEWFLPLFGGDILNRHRRENNRTRTRRALLGNQLLFPSLVIISTDNAGKQN
ncbi:hypothetical protein SKAU_G00408690 [Synaphobranchus kaupii]|uniref:Uncharacterized protein n=1 Tax=Synaphobranchus kaupii TaxID=118154 RepID=A0A9Q1EAK4_SYNKA|nr:hypothetical protein SKAU_G00408690 [Synaphobranchus kaupii]